MERIMRFRKTCARTRKSGRPMRRQPGNKNPAAGAGLSLRRETIRVDQ
jgi:hypothetical protein